MLDDGALRESILHPRRRAVLRVLERLCRERFWGRLAQPEACQCCLQTPCDQFWIVLALLQEETKLVVRHGQHFATILTINLLEQDAVLFLENAVQAQDGPQHGGVHRKAVENQAFRLEILQFRLLVRVVAVHEHDLVGEANEIVDDDRPLLPHALGELGRRFCNLRQARGDPHAHCGCERSLVQHLDAANIARFKGLPDRVIPGVEDRVASEQLQI